MALKDTEPETGWQENVHQEEKKKCINSIMAPVCADGNSQHKLELLHSQRVRNLGRMRTYVIQRNLAKGPTRDVQKYPLYLDFIL